MADYYNKETGIVWEKTACSKTETGLGKVLEILYQSADDETTLVAQILSDQTVVCSALTPLTVLESKNEVDETK